MKNVLWIIFAIFIPVRFPRIENVESKTMTEVFHIAHSNSSNIITSRYALAKKRFRLSRVKEKIYARPPQPLDHETKTIEREERLYIHKKNNTQEYDCELTLTRIGLVVPKSGAALYLHVRRMCVVRRQNGQVKWFSVRSFAEPAPSLVSTQPMRNCVYTYV